MNKFRQRKNDDKGGAITIMVLMILMIMILIAGLVMDFGRSIVTRTQIENAAQKSAEVGIRQQNSVGGLSHLAGTAAVNEYLRMRNTWGAETYSCGGNSYPKITVSFDTQRRDPSNHNLPKTFNGTGSIPTWAASDFLGTKYTVVTLRIVDVSNQWWNVFGSCQIIRTEKSAIIYTD